MRVVGIDPGVVNLGFVDALLTAPTFRVVDAQVIDVRYLQHKTVAACQCQLPHTLELSSYIAHFIQEYRLQDADVVLIERQPPQSAGYATQQLLQALLRQQPKLVHPTAIQRMYGATKSDTYELRKQKSVAFARPYLSNCQHFATSERQHDIADAVCMLKTYCDSKLKTPDVKPPSMSFEEFISQYAYDEIEKRSTKPGNCDLSSARH